MGVFDGVELDDLVLHGPRVTLRPWALEDAPAVHEAMQDPDMHRFLAAIPDPYTPADAEQFVTEFGHEGRADGTAIDAAVVRTDTGELVAAVALRLPGSPVGVGARRFAVTGYWTGPSARGFGYAAEATDVLARWGFEHGLDRIELFCVPHNLASAATALRAGFRFEGIRRGAPAAPSAPDSASFARLAGDDGRPVRPSFPRLREPLTDGVIALRPAVPDDAPGWAEMERDEVSVAVSLTGKPLDEPGIRTALTSGMLDWLVGNNAQLAIVDVATGAFAGFTQLRRNGPPGTANIGYGVHPAFRGRRYTTRALRLVSEWAFESAGFARLELGAKWHNIASQKVAEAAGFVREGVLAGRLREPSGEYADEVYYGLTRPRSPEPRSA